MPTIKFPERRYKIYADIFKLFNITRQFLINFLEKTLLSAFIVTIYIPETIPDKSSCTILSFLFNKAE